VHKHWTLCGGTGAPACEVGGLPGRDQYQLKTAADGVAIAGSAQCDTALTAGSCQALGPNAAGSEYLSITAPSSSSDSSSSFRTVVTYVAIP